MSVSDKIVGLLRRIFTVNHRHVDPHDVYTPTGYRKGLADEQLAKNSGKTLKASRPLPYIVSSKQTSPYYYYLRDNRRKYPNRLVIANELGTGAQSATKLTDFQLDHLASMNYMSKTALKESSYKSEYPTIRYLK